MKRAKEQEPPAPPPPAPPPAPVGRLFDDWATI